MANHYVKCPHCGATLSVPDEYINDNRLHCSQCNQNFDNNKKPAKERVVSASEKQVESMGFTGWTKQQKRGLWCLAFLVCVILYHCGAFESDGVPQIGDRVTVVSDTWGTLDEESSERLGDAMVADDAVGRYELTRQGKSKYIWKGSKGKVIHGSWTQVQIRFDDGSLWWVATDAVKKE